MFSFINLVLTVIILIRVFKYNNFYYVQQDFRLHEAPKPQKSKQGDKQAKNRNVK